MHVYKLHISIRAPENEIKKKNKLKLVYYYYFAPVPQMETSRFFFFYNPNRENANSARAFESSHKTVRRWLNDRARECNTFFVRITKHVFFIIFFLIIRIWCDDNETKLLLFIFRSETIKYDHHRVPADDDDPGFFFFFVRAGIGFFYTRIYLIMRYCYRYHYYYYTRVQCYGIVFPILSPWLSIRGCTGTPTINSDSSGRDYANALPQRTPRRTTTSWSSSSRG